MIRALIAGRSRVHGEALAVALSHGRRVQVLATVSHPQEVLARLVEVAPDIVLVDYATPEAVRIVADIRRRAPNVRVVAITLGETEAEVIQLAEAGVAGYVLPDGSLDDLIIAVESAVRGELYCPPRMAFSLLRRVGVMATVRRDEEQGATRSPLGALTGREREILHRSPTGHRAANREESCTQHSQEAACAHTHRRVDVVPARRLPPHSEPLRKAPRPNRCEACSSLNRDGGISAGTPS